MIQIQNRSSKLKQPTHPSYHDPQSPRFLEALNEKKKIRVRLYSVADNGVVDRVCAPMSYGLGVANQDGLNR